MADAHTARTVRLLLLAILLAATFASALFGTVALTIAMATATIGVMILAATVAVVGAITRATAIDEDADD